MTLDWPRIVLNLRSSGLSCAALARRVNMDPSTVQRIARGERKVDPPFSQAMALLDLHHALCPERHRVEELRR